MHNPNPHPHRPAAVPPTHQGGFVKLLTQAQQATHEFAGPTSSDLNALERHLNAALNEAKIDGVYREAAEGVVRALLDGTPSNQAPGLITQRPESWTQIDALLVSSHRLHDKLVANLTKKADAVNDPQMNAKLNHCVNTVRDAARHFIEERTKALNVSLASAAR